MRKYSTKDFQKVLKKNGYELSRTKGSHMIYKKEDRTLTIYKNKKGIAPSVTNKLIKEFNLAA